MPSSREPKEFWGKRPLAVIKELVANNDYHYSGHVHNYIAEGSCEEADLVCCILGAKRIHKIEEDELCVAVDGCKYTILGKGTQGYPFYTCGKIIRDENDQNLYFFITAHDAD